MPRQIPIDDSILTALAEGEMPASFRNLSRFARLLRRLRLLDEDMLVMRRP